MAPERLSALDMAFLCLEGDATPMHMGAVATFRPRRGWNADRVAVLLPNSHPDLVDAAAQRALTGLIAPKYRLRLLRSTPDNTHAVVVAEPPASATGNTDAAARAVLTRAHARLGNIWPDAPDDVADQRLIDLPRHRVAEVRTELGD
ncbi:hypothetical protein ACZ91_61780 [Streptomyces regensis]|nr:hypothetical protein ACZ91_61780 [Streptomyces regensis]